MMAKHLEAWQKQVAHRQYKQNLYKQAIEKRRNDLSKQAVLKWVSKASDKIQKSKRIVIEDRLLKDRRLYNIVYRCAMTWRNKVKAKVMNRQQDNSNLMDTSEKNTDAVILSQQKVSKPPIQQMDMNRRIYNLDNVLRDEQLHSPKR